MTPETRPTPSRRAGDGIAVPVAAVLLVGLAAARARYGIDFLDGGHYVATAVRLAQGARLFVDEMSLQATGFLVPAAFAKVWMALFGMKGIVLALRLFYVALAAGAGFVVYRALRPTFGPWPSLAAAAVPLFAPPYNLVAPSYNTGAILGLVLFVALGFAAVRDRSSAEAFAAGAALVFSAVSYVTLAIGLVVGFVSFVAVARDRRLAAWFTAGCAAVGFGFIALLLAITSVDALRATLAYATSAMATSNQILSPGAKLLYILGFVVRPFVGVWSLPMWLLAAVAAVPVVPSRIRAGALALLPFAVALPPLLSSWPPSQGFIGALPSIMLVTFCFTASIPVGSWLAGAPRHRADLLALLALAVPLGVVDWLLVIYSSSAAYRRGPTFTGFAPFALALVVAWAVFIADEGGPRMLAAASAALIALVVVMLFATAYRDDTPVALRTPVTAGAAAGILTTPQQAARIAKVQETGRRYVGPDDRVLVLGAPGAYVFLGGRMDTNAVWLADGPSDAETLAYFDRAGGPPRVALVATNLRAGKRPMPSDPLLAYLKQRYTLAETAGGFEVYVRR